jgi:8-amino-7-oxononanoate synthase
MSRDKLLKLRQRFAQDRRPKSKLFVENREHWPLLSVEGRQLIDFRSLDALALWQDRRIQEALRKSVQILGKKGPKAPRGAGALSEELLRAETAFSSHMHSEAAVFFRSKSQAMLSLLSALIDEGDRISANELCLAPLEDLSFLLGAKIDWRSEGIGLLIASGVDAGASRESTVADLAVYETLGILDGRVSVPLAEAGFFIFDESAALGVRGLTGAGILEESAVERRSQKNTCYINDISNFQSPFNSFIAGPEWLCDYLRSNSTSLRIDTAPSPEEASFLSFVLDNIALKSAERLQLQACVKRVRDELAAFHFANLVDSDSHILAFEFETWKGAADFYAALLEQSILSDLVSIPKIRKERALVRIIITLSHSEKFVLQLLEALSQIRKRMSPL